MRCTESTREITKCPLRRSSPPLLSLLSHSSPTVLQIQSSVHEQNTQTLEDVPQPIDSGGVAGDGRCWRRGVRRIWSTLLSVRPVLLQRFRATDRSDRRVDVEPHPAVKGSSGLFSNWIRVHKGRVRVHSPPMHLAPDRTAE